MASPAPDGKERFLTAPMIAALAVSTLLLALNYLAFPEFGSFGNENSIQWLISSWNKQTDYEHGWLVVPIIVCLIYTYDAADDTTCVNIGGVRIIKKKHKYNIYQKEYEKQYIVYAVGVN